MKNKVLSICIPTFNRKAFLTKLVKHILSFDLEIFKKVNLIVSDNDSSDGTIQFLKDLDIQGLSYFIYNQNAYNIGATKNLEKLIDIAPTPYIWWLGDDDWIELENIKSVLENICLSNPDILVLDRKVVFEDGFVVNSLFRNYFKDSITLKTKDILSIVGPLTLLGCISSIVFKKKNLNSSIEFNTFCEFKTSHPHVGYLIANYFHGITHVSIDNKITTYAFRQTPEEYEHNYKKDSSKKINKDMIAVLATGLPAMYAYLIKNGFLASQVISDSKEFLWTEKRKISTLIHLDLLLLISIIKLQIDESETEQVFDIGKNQIKYHFFLSKIILKFFWCLHRFLNFKRGHKSKTKSLLTLIFLYDFVWSRCRGFFKSFKFASYPLHHN